MMGLSSWVASVGRIISKEISECANDVLFYVMEL